jgi:predicted nucleotidyltransferase
MSNTYNINFEDFRQHADFEEMFTALEQCFRLYGIDFYLIGAIAKNIWMDKIHRAALSKATKDFAVAILIPNKQTYEALKQHIVKEYPFAASQSNAFSFIWKEKYVVDLLPFGEIENEAARVIVDGKGFTSIDVPGFYEIYLNDLQTIQIENKTAFKITSLTGIVILKLFTWNDRPESKEKDITDTGDILHHYFGMHNEFIWQQYAHLFDEYNDLKQLAAVVMGFEIKRILGGNTVLIQKIISIIQSDIQKDSNSILGIKLARYFENTIDENLALFKCVLAGLCAAE